MYCKKCGARLKYENAKFCSKCGAQITANNSPFVPEANKTESNIQSKSSSYETQKTPAYTASSEPVSGGRFNNNTYKVMVALIACALFGFFVYLCATGNVGISLIALAVGIGLIAVAVYNVNKEKEQLEKGEILNRNTGVFAPKFYSMEEVFTMNKDWEVVLEALRKTDYKGSISSYSKEPGSCAINYTAGYYKARFYKSTASSGSEYVYVFTFTHWRERNGVPYSENKMNVLLTAIEKTMLKLDPGTKVTTRKGDYKRKIDFL